MKGFEGGVNAMLKEHILVLNNNIRGLAILCEESCGHFFALLTSH